MNPKPRPIESILAAAVDLTSEAERRRFVEQACGADAELQRRVQELIENHFRAGSFLESPVAGSNVLRGLKQAAPEEISSAPPSERETVPPASASSTDNAQAGKSAPARSEAVPQEELSFLEPSQDPQHLGRLGHYEVRRLLGAGGMGAVLQAFDEKLQREVAIKVMAPELAVSATARQRFIREARAAAAVNHENVVAIHAIEEEHRPPYIVMQFVEGESLQEKINREAALAVPEIVEIGRQIAAGLAAAHARGLVHRDIKPANILLETREERDKGRQGDKEQSGPTLCTHVKLTDFGLARAVNDHNLTQSGMVAGTPAYMSPEQAGGEKIDHRSDLFSLGSVLYAMCTGQAPFHADNSMALLLRVMEETPRPIRDLNPRTPEWLCAIIDKLHAKNREKRYQSATEVAEALALHDTAGAGSTAGASRTITTSKPRVSRKLRWVLLAALLVAIGVPTTVYLIHRQGPHDVANNSPSSSEQHFTTASEASGNHSSSSVSPVVVGSSSESPSSPPAPPPVVVPGQPFVLIPIVGGPERFFASLADAVAAGARFDTIEIRDDGPFKTDPVNFPVQMRIRAGPGFSPVIELTKDEKGKDRFAPLFTCDFQLALEGLTLKHTSTIYFAVQARRLAAAYCNFERGMVSADGGVLRHCRFAKFGFNGGTAFPLTFEHCLMPGGMKLGVREGPRDSASAVALVHCTITDEKDTADQAVTWYPRDAGKTPDEPQRLSMEYCIVDCKVFQFVGIGTGVPLDWPWQDYMHKVWIWNEKGNLYRPNMKFLKIAIMNIMLGGPRDIDAGFDLAGWQKFWELQDRGCKQVMITLDDDMLMTEDTIRAAGLEGKTDLPGANVKILGPGGPYWEFRKRKDDYQKWQKKVRDILEQF
jgi:serine/threonine protein kinase